MMDYWNYHERRYLATEPEKRSYWVGYYKMFEPARQFAICHWVLHPDGDTTIDYPIIGTREFVEQKFNELAIKIREIYPLPRNNNEDELDTNQPILST